MEKRKEVEWCGVSRMEGQLTNAFVVRATVKGGEERLGKGWER